MHRDRAPTDAPPFDLVAIAASAGGLSALTIVLADLPAAFPLPLAIVQHVDPVRKSLLVEILSRPRPSSSNPRRKPR